jgi:hypothetical protein
MDKIEIRVLCECLRHESMQIRKQAGRNIKVFKEYGKIMDVRHKYMFNKIVYPKYH